VRQPFLAHSKGLSFRASEASQGISPWLLPFALFARRDSSLALGMTVVYGVPEISGVPDAACRSFLVIGREHEQRASEPRA
jgi:hypothetical protein